MNLQSASYTPNLLNQYTQRTVPGAVPVLGLAEAASTVTVNSGSTYRHGEYFWKELSAANTTMPVWQSVSVQAVHGVNNNTVSGNVFVPQTPEAYSYDLDGNLTGDGRWTYSWDAENRLVRLVAATAVGPQQRIDFEYDAQSRRIRKKIWNNTSGTGTPATDIKFLYQGWNLMAELNALSSDAVIRSFVWGNDLSGTFQGAGGVGGLLAVKSGGVCHFTAYDGNGNVIALVDGSTGSPSAQYEYGPFGEMIRSTGSLGNANSFRFSTKYQDEESGLYYYSYRYYNTVFGNWLSRDPIEEKGGRNLYGFVGNNPVSFIDPFGLERIELWIAAFISPIEIRFPYYSNPNAFWHGDDRDFNTGTRPVSSRVWHWIVIETDPAKKPIVNNISGAGLTTVTTYGPLGLETTKTGQAAAPPPAIITRNGCILYVWITADEGNPLIAGAPHIKYSYNFTFDVKKGELNYTRQP